VPKANLLDFILVKKGKLTENDVGDARKHVKTQVDDDCNIKCFVKVGQVGVHPLPDNFGPSQAHGGIEHGH
jgi:hypothetical protein